MVPGSEPGPPVDGALLRIDEWILDVNEDGTPLLQVNGGREWRDCENGRYYVASRLRDYHIPYINDSYPLHQCECSNIFLICRLRAMRLTQR